MIDGMDGLSISKVAERTGFSPSALRFYESAGLVTPARTAAGYRAYDEASIETLRFIARAKRLGLSLDEISDLVTLFDGRRCGPVQDHLRALFRAKLDGAREQVATLDAFTGELERAAARLDVHTPDGPCDADCGCTADPAGEVVPAPVLLGRTPRPARPAEVPIACTLGAADVQTRIADWHHALRSATRRDATARGVRVELPRNTPLGPLATLIEAEQTCCRFLSFTLTVGLDAVTLGITGPAGAEAIIDELTGLPSWFSG